MMKFADGNILGEGQVGGIVSSGGIYVKQSAGDDRGLYIEYPRNADGGFQTQSDETKLRIAVGLDLFLRESLHYPHLFRHRKNYHYLNTGLSAKFLDRYDARATKTIYLAKQPGHSTTVCLVQPVIPEVASTGIQYWRSEGSTPKKAEITVAQNALNGIIESLQFGAQQHTDTVQEPGVVSEWSIAPPDKSGPFARILGSIGLR